MSRDSARIAVTGANGQLGKVLLRRLAERWSRERSDAAPTRALVRSQRAADQIRALELGDAIEIVLVDYTDETSMEKALEGISGIVHLVGIIREGGGATYETAHERTCETLARVASRTGAERIVYLSILGSDPASKNPCLASKGRAEAILSGGPVPVTALRVPMVIGGDDDASRALRGQALAATLPLFGGGRSLQQPIDVRDVVTAILSALVAAPGNDLSLDLAGPECLDHRALVMRVAALHGRTPKTFSIPMGLVRTAIRALELLSPSPPMTLAMFDILQHDDRVDPSPACEALGLQLTPLDETLATFVGPDADPGAAAGTETPR